MLILFVPTSILTIRRKNMETTKPTIDQPFTVLSGPCFKNKCLTRQNCARGPHHGDSAHAQKFAPRSFRLPKARWNTLQVCVNLGVFDIRKKKHIAGYVPTFETTPLRGLFRNRQFSPVTSEQHILGSTNGKRAGIICSMYMYVNNIISLLVYVMQCRSIQICSMKFYSLQVSSILF